MQVPILDLTKQHERLKADIAKSLEEVMDKAHFILGEQVTRLEDNVAEFCGVRYGVGVGNGSDALHLSLLGCGVEAGDEVITTPFTFFATAGAVARIGAKPVFVDIEPHTFNIDPAKLEAAITPRTKAIIPVHLYGQTANMDPIKDIAERYNLVIIEDAAQAIGAEFNQCKAGSIGSAGCFSFFPTKNLGAYGDGGMVITDDEQIAEKIRMLRAHGSKPKYTHHVVGFNSRLDEVQAAILNVKFPNLLIWNDHRRGTACIYSQQLNERVGQYVTTPYVEPKGIHIFHQYTIRIEQRDELQQYLAEKGIGTMVYYPQPLHLQPVFQDLGYKIGDFPETEAACKQVLSLPMYPGLEQEQIQYVIDQIVHFYDREG